MTRRRASLRLRLTLSYGVLFFVIGFLLLVLSYVLLRQVAIKNPGELANHTAQELHLSQAYLRQHIDIADRRPPVRRRLPAADPGPDDLGGASRAHRRHVLGAGRCDCRLGPRRLVDGRAHAAAGQEISAVARRLSASTLHERINREGPQDELGQLADTFDAMLGRLETAFNAQQEFVSNASHELRTPLAIMRTELDVTLADPATDADDLRRMAQTIRDAISRSEDVIDRLLVLAESDELTERVAVDVSRLAQGAADSHARQAEARDISFRVEGERAVTLGDEALLERLVDNLVDNAVRYASPGSLVRVTAGVDPGGQVTLQVANEGDSIGPDEVPRLFERFYRRGTSRDRRSGGSGLGLAIVAAVADVHGGTVAATAPPTGGLVVTVSLPHYPAGDARAE